MYGVAVSRERGDVALLTLNRPDRLNALDDQLLRSLPTVVRELAADRSVRAIVIAGNERTFSAGGDLGDLGSRLSEVGIEGARQHMLAYQGVIRAIQEADVPVVAAVSGSCAGAGISIACACDIVVADRSVRFTPGFIKVGLIPDLGALYFWLESMGPRLTKELAMLGEPLTAEAALARGLVNHVVDDGQAGAVAMSLAQRLAVGPASALSMVKALVNAATAADRDRSLQLEAFAQAAAFRTGEVDEGVAAFQGKRPPVFAGRQA
jgi:2-(1,2-epoxy-1,2-dihydrophenyl)acetyl-CoA isomerase